MTAGEQEQALADSRAIGERIANIIWSDRAWENWGGWASLSGEESRWVEGCREVTVRNGHSTSRSLCHLSMLNGETICPHCGMDYGTEMSPSSRNDTSSTQRGRPGDN